MNMSVKDIYLPKNFYTSPKQISGYAPGSFVAMLLLLQSPTDWEK